MLIDNFSDANIDFPDYFHKLLSMKAWTAKQDVVTLREEPSRDIWLMHPAIVNAWYSPNHNTISRAHFKCISCTKQVFS